LERLYTDNS
jgi:hypothetical protein